MSASDRRAVARRKAWGRGPLILPFDRLEGRQLLSDASALIAPLQTPLPAPAPAPTPTATAPDPGATVATATQTATPPVVPTEVVTVNPTAVPVPDAPKSDLILSGFKASGGLDWGDSFTASGAVQNVGPGPAPSGVKVDLYASARPTLDAGAVYVGTTTLKDGISAGGQATFTSEFHAPPKPIAGLSAGTFYLIPKVDADNAVAETNDADNGGTSGSPVQPVVVAPKLAPSLTPTLFSAFPIGATQVQWGGTLQVSAQIANTVAGTVAPATRARIVMVPTGQSIASPGAVTIGELYFPEVSAYPPVMRQGTVYLPRVAPVALAGVSQVTVGLIPDADYVVRKPLTTSPVQGVGLDQVALTISAAPAGPVSVPRPDLTVKSLQPLDTTLSWGQPFQVKATVANVGGGDAEPVRVRFLLTDANRPNDAPLALADAIVPKLQAGFQQDVLQTIDLEGKLPDGRDPSQIAGRIIVQVDPEHNLDQSNTSNDVLASGPVKLKLLTRDDVVQPTTTPAAPVSSTPPPRAPAVNPPKVTAPPTTTPATVQPTATHRLTPQQMRANAQAQMRLARQMAAAQRRATRPLPVRLRNPRVALRVVHNNAQPAGPHTAAHPATQRSA